MEEERICEVELFIFDNSELFSFGCFRKTIQIAQSVQVELFHKVLLKEKLSLQLRSAAITYTVLFI